MKDTMTSKSVFFKNLFFTVLFSIFGMQLVAQSATWIWYPGDYEIWLGNNFNNRRTERGAFSPPFWKVDGPYVMVEFSTQVDLAEQETAQIFAEGHYNIKIDGNLMQDTPSITVPRGKHSISIKVFSMDKAPALYVKGKTIYTGPHWKVTAEEKDQSGTIYVNAGFWNFDSPESLPSQYKLATKPITAVKTEKTGKGVLVDFGKETMGYPYFHGLKGSGKLNIYYGESREEALDTKQCELLDKLDVDASVTPDLLMKNSRAYRYLYIETGEGLTFNDVSMMFEYQPLDYRGSFRCNDTLINKIWDVSASTLHLTTREFFMDGIKRDRWVWSGDAYQSYLMSYYLFFDAPTVQRSIQLLRGKDPVTSHVNTIMDYTFYWFLSIYDYYMYTGDKAFIEQMYPRMETMMAFVLSRRNQRGLLEGMPGDWIFIDWTDGPMDKNGEISFEQLLFSRSLETMSLCANILHKSSDMQKYQELASSVKSILLNEFWDNRKHAFINNEVNGKSDGAVTRYTNMFAIFFNYLTDKQKQEVKDSVILNDKIMKISTPYMRFYELEAMCSLGETSYVLNEMRSYWGGMLKKGATSFWEKYNPEEKGTEYLAMYGRPYGKSLCHAWGASPIYLLGKYYLGVKPIDPGYSKFEIRPALGDLKWMEGCVPTPKGTIKVYMNPKTIKVTAGEGEGYLYFRSVQRKPKANLGKIERINNDEYRLLIKGNRQEVIVKL